MAFGRNPATGNWEDIPVDPISIPGGIDVAALNQPASSNPIDTLKAVGNAAVTSTEVAPTTTSGIPPTSESRYSTTTESIASANKLVIPVVDETIQTPASSPAAAGGGVSTSDTGNMATTGVQVTTPTQIDTTKSIEATDAMIAAEKAEAKAQEPEIQRMAAQLDAIDAKNAEWEKYNELKAKADAENRKQEALNYEAAVKEYGNKALQNKGFWAVSSTPEKIGMAFNLISAALWAAARQPDRAEKVLATANKQIDDAVSQDLAMQRDQLGRAKDVLGEKYNMMKDRFQLVKDENLDQQARQKGTIDFMLSGYNNIKTKMDLKGVNTTGLAKRIAELEAKKADIEIQEQKANQVQTVESKQVIMPKSRDLVANMEDMGPEKSIKYVADLQASAKSFNDDKAIDRHKGMAQTRRVLDQFKDDPQGLSLQIGKFIANDLNQNSFNPELAQMLFQTSVPAEIAKKWNSLTGKGGRIPPEMVTTLRNYLDRNIQSDLSNPDFSSKLQAATAAQRNADHASEVQRTLFGGGKATKKGSSGVKLLE